MWSSRLLLVAAALPCSLASSVDREQYKYYIELAVNKTDVNPKDGNIDCNEFATLVNDVLLVGCPASGPSPPRGSCIDANEHCQAADTNNDNVVTETELVDYVTAVANDNSFDRDYYQKILNLFIKGLTSVDLDFGELTEGIGEVNTCIEQNAAALTIEFVSPTSVDQLLPGDRAQITCKIEFAMGLRASITPCVPNQCTKMSFKAGSSIIQSRLYYKTQGEAKEASVTAEAQFGTPAAAAAAAGIPVTSTTPPVVTAVAGNYEIEYPIIGGAGGGILVLLLITIGIAIFMSGRERQKRSVSALKGMCTHCCNTGCCSPYAFTSWSATLSCGVVLLAIPVVFLFIAVTPIKDDVICIIDGIYDLQAIGKNLSAVAEVAANIPTDIIDPIRPRLNYLDIAVVVPAALAGLLLLLTSGLSFRTSTTMCCPKIFVVLAYVFLLLCLILYAIFAGLAIALNEQADLKTFVNIATSICEDNVPLWDQTLSDAVAARDRARLMGQDTSEFDTQISQWMPAVDSLSSTCTCITDLFNLLPALFVPGMATTLMILYLWISSITWCCAGKCCSSPMITGKEGGTGVKMSTSASSSSSVEQSV